MTSRAKLTGGGRGRNNAFVACLLFALAPMVAHPLCAQADAAQAAAPTFRVRSNIVTVPALVRDKHGAHVWALQADDFAILDNGVPQHVLLDDTPLPPERAVVIVVQDNDDTALLEGSLGDSLRAFLDAFPDNDTPVAILTAGGRVNTWLPFTTDRERAIKSVRALGPDGDAGGPRILDAVYQASRMLQENYATRQKIVLLVSGAHDGDSAGALEYGLEKLEGVSKSKREAWRSAHVSEEVLAYAEANNIVIDAIEFNRIKLGAADYWKSFETSAISLNMISLLIHAGDWLRRDIPRHLAEATGGEVLAAGRKAKMSIDALKIAGDVPALYALSFRPSNSVAGLHRLEVTVPGRAVTVRARGFYWAGGDAAIPKAVAATESAEASN